MNILVSACLLGVDCKYNGGNNLNKKVVEISKENTIVKICPEVLGGMSIPRESVEIKDGVVTSISGKNLDLEYRKGVEIAIDIIKGKNIDYAILQSRSPTCGVNEIYDGTFSKSLIKDSGLFAKALVEKGINVIDVEDL